MSLFNMENLLTETVMDHTSITNTTLSMTKSYRSLAMQHILEMHEELNQANKILYRSILESENDIEIVNEGFSDFFEKVKDIIVKFLKWIKSLFERFIAQLHKFVGSEKYILKKKDKLNKFNSDHEFDIEGYNYTFVSNVPAIHALAEFNQSFVGLDLSSLNDTTGKNKDITDRVSSAYDDLLESLDNGEWYDQFRADCIGQTDPIDEEDFADELFRVYRDGENTESTITVTNSIVMDSLNNLETYKKLEEDVKKTKSKIEKDYERIKKDIEKMISRNKDRDLSKTAIPITVRDGYTPAPGELVVSQDTLNKLDLYMKAKADQVVKMSSIHSMAFSYKLDAITDRTKQDKKILYTALSKVTKDLKLESMIDKYSDVTDYSYIEESTSEALAVKICNAIGVDVRDSQTEAAIKVNQFIKKSPLAIIRKTIGNIIILIGMVSGGLVMATGVLGLVISFLPILIGGMVMAISSTVGSTVKGSGSDINGLKNDLERTLKKVNKMPDSKEKKMMKRALERSLSELKVKTEAAINSEDNIDVLESYSDSVSSFIDSYADTFVSGVEFN